ncbi:hypothetical protein HDV00_001359, partial [Rhizophlyctis rosea]
MKQDNIQNRNLVTAEVITLSNSTTVKNVHVAQYQPTDRPIEDRFCTGPSPGPVPPLPKTGHGGAATADHISHALPNSIFTALPTPSSLSNDDIVRTLSDTFEKVDQSILSDFTNNFSLILPIATPGIIGSRLERPEVLERAQRAKSGSTALGVYVVGGRVFVVNVGDCRAGQVDNEGNIKAKQLSKDLNAKSSAEVQRLRLEHPGEEDTVVVGSRVLGRIGVTRSFGDAYYKFPNTSYTTKILGHPLLTPPGHVSLSDQRDVLFAFYKTPPYLSAVPQ